MKIFAKDETHSSIPQKTPERNIADLSDEDLLGSPTPSTSTFQAPTPCPKRQRKRSAASESVDAAILAALTTTSQQYQPPATNECEDLSFFKSILPTIKQFTEDDKLDFRMDVLGLIKKYRNKNRFPHNHHYNSSISAGPESHHDSMDYYQF